MTVIGSVDQIEEGAAKSFSYEKDGEQVDILVVNWDGQFYAYRNHCPHQGTPLDWEPDDFISEDGNFLQCATHGALFRPDDGQCVDGPCVGQGLEKVDIYVKDKNIEVD